MKEYAAIAVLAAASASTSAQSSVTVFGVLDANVGSVNNGAGSIKSVGNSGNETSRLGFRGTEDLGGGLRAGFWLEGQIFNDTEAEVLWLIVGAPEVELEPHEKGDMSLFYPTDPTQLPPELKGVEWPPKSP